MKKLFLLLSFIAVNLSFAQETEKPVTTTTTTTTISTTSNITKKPQYIGKKMNLNLIQLI